jgi:hypothetical protein
MLSKVASVSLLALSSVALVSAAPTAQRGGKYTWGGASNSGQYSPPATSDAASFPLSNGFPNIANPSSQLTAIEQQAQGTLPNGPPPASVTADTLTSLELIAFNELFEVAFFTDLIYNITNNVPGYQVGGNGVQQFVLNALTAVQAQEELHALNANGALAHFGASPIQPCKYQFPVSTFADAIGLASTFTDVVLGTLQDVQSKLATDGDAGLIRGIGSVIGQEGEQNGYYRTLLNKIPSALPFLTTSTREFAFSALNQNFVVPGSCPNIGEISLPVFGPLTVVTSNISPSTQNVQFSFTATASANAASAAGLSVVYINQQNLPVVEPLLNPTQTGNTVSFSAAFPYAQFEMNGLTIAAVVKGSGPFANADAVAQATVFGPGLIEIN